MLGPTSHVAYSGTSGPTQASAEDRETFNSGTMVAEPLTDASGSGEEGTPNPIEHGSAAQAKPDAGPSLGGAKPASSKLMTAGNAIAVLAVGISFGFLLGGAVGAAAGGAWAIWHVMEGRQDAASNGSAGGAFDEIRRSLQGRQNVNGEALAEAEAEAAPVPMPGIGPQADAGENPGRAKPRSHSAVATAVRLPEPPGATASRYNGTDDEDWEEEDETFETGGAEGVPNAAKNDEAPPVDVGAGYVVEPLHVGSNYTSRAQPAMANHGKPEPQQE
ncbi:hypothetical protein WG922_08585 [Ramlibacter sp. AN1015]|uniref:hypothetical protein n=1 Tax=Ramlibacter sp. AN1015 TaxID=3133428 RepID=UPI0030C57763